ncbi:hypothetical protein CANCADRAFT_2684 [Tortispora caseinolytica NRRL Y-17796]|uniref:Uncharacterized protein n=1 Tax=Tortispora caseinolytica NRRL Y-17796 TaxID=767744 RepID=A0A1E4TGR7_9ASCO|nr:hypothetical protein CANCADRAFT_2684 [Tortispora caseinolytica NRRL Y-17796]
MFSNLLSQVKTGKSSTYKSVSPLPETEGVKLQKNPEKTVKVIRTQQPAVRALSEKDRLLQQEKVKRLKEARATEKRQKEETVKNVKRTQKLQKAKAAAKPVPIGFAGPKPIEEPPKPRLSFRELMQKARSSENKKLKIDIKSSRSLTPAEKRALERKKAREERLASKSRSVSAEPQIRTNAETSASINESSSYAKPSKELQAKLSKRKRIERIRDRYEEDYDEDLDDFIEDSGNEEEEQSDTNDYRKEIWKILGRGRSREDFLELDEDLDDDMEASGSQVLEEELRSSKYAQLEDLEEEKREEERQRIKRQRLRK